MDWNELDWIELNWIELNWIQLNSTELNWIEQNRRIEGWRREGSEMIRRRKDNEEVWNVKYLIKIWYKTNHMTAELIQGEIRRYSGYIAMKTKKR